MVEKGEHNEQPHWKILPKLTLFFCVTESTENVDDDDGDPEHSDPDSNIDAGSPVLKCDGSSSNFKRQNGGPLEDIVPTHGETWKVSDDN